MKNKINTTQRLEYIDEDITVFFKKFNKSQELHKLKEKKSSTKKTNESKRKYSLPKPKLTMKEIYESLSDSTRKELNNLTIKFGYKNTIN